MTGVREQSKGLNSINTISPLLKAYIYRTFILPYYVSVSNGISDLVAFHQTDSTICLILGHFFVQCFQKGNKHK